MNSAVLNAKKLDRGQSRRGFTLVEALVSITIGSMLFAGAVELLRSAMHVDSTSTSAAQESQSLDRLVEQFRNDVWQATAVRSAPPQLCTISLSDNRRVEYARDGAMLLRTVYERDKPTSRDAFAVGDDTTVQIDLQPAKEPTEAVLVLEQTDGAAATSHDAKPAAGETVRMTVPIGWDHRFAPPAKNSKAK